MTIEDATIECSICKAIIEDVYLCPDMIARFYKWTGMVSTKNGISYKYWYCPKHPINEITDFQEKTIDNKFDIRF